MGAVFLAERADGQFQSQVALKLIRRGLDTEEIVNRFCNERQILAGLNHPNIARLFDGGTTEDGRPYFVMEYVEGKPINQYCDELKLDTEARLKLFRDVCAAAQHAHQKLIVHRDLKPGNILVTGDGEVKLLDFGIAKLLADPARVGAATLTGARALTPDYASPEQVCGEQITTASDVYSLGVVLYELLTGRRPYSLSELALPEAVRVICEQEVERPSVVSNRSRDGSRRQRLSAELDNITLKALRKEPQRRYASVEQFSEDIGRYLAGLPVMAQPSTFSYRAGKFVKRNRVAVAAAALILIALLAGIGATARQARIARAQQQIADAERARAERRFDDVRQLANWLIFDFHAEIEKLPGATLVREKLIRRSLAYLDDLSRDAAGDASLRRELARAYQALGDAQGQPQRANRGDLQQALASYRKAQAINEALLAENPRDAEARRNLSTNHARVGQARAQSGDQTGAAENFRESLVLRQAAAAANPTDAQARDAVANSYLVIGEQSDNPAVALKYLRQALAIRRRIAAERPADAQAQDNLWGCYVRMGEAMRRLGDATGAVTHYRAALRAIEAAVAIVPANNQYLRHLGDSHLRLGRALITTDQAAARRHYRQAIELFESLLAASPANAEAQRDLAISFQSLGDGLATIGDWAGALEQYRKWLALAEAAATADPANRLDAQILWHAHYSVSHALEKVGQPAEAKKHYRLALALVEQRAAANPTDKQLRRDLLITYREAGDLLRRLGELAAALELQRKGLAIAEQVAAGAPGDAEAQSDLARARATIGHAYAELAQAGAATPAQRIESLLTARAWYQKSLELWDDLQRRGALPEKYVEQPGKLVRHIASCDKMLKQLRARTTASPE
jgi:tetratricopeptide (TPR) repeat protein